MSVQAISYECKEVGRKIKRQFLLLYKPQPPYLIFLVQKRSTCGYFLSIQKNIKLNYLFQDSVGKKKFY